MKQLYNLCFSILSIQLLITDHAHAKSKQDCVVLLHGMARTYQSMLPLEDALNKTGFRVVNINYPSQKYKLEVLAPLAIESAKQACSSQPTGSMHFVTHSLGGILIRQYLKDNQIENLGNVVMIAPPNQGSEVADNWKNIPGYQWLNGPVGLQLGTDENSIPRSLGKVTFSLGVIAGNKTFNPILSLSLPNPDDGKVSVESTKVEGMKDFIVLPYTHTFIMRSPETIKQTKHFLSYGTFLHNSNVIKKN